MTKYLLSICLLFLLSLDVSAVTLKRLYEVSVPVTSQSTGERSRAISAAFGELLIKITGQPDVLEQESGRALLKQAKRFVRGFRYALPTEENSERYVTMWPVEGVDEPPADESEEADIQVPQVLVVSFDEKAVGDAVWRSRLPLWGKSRPETLVWLAFQDSEKRMALGAKHNSQLQSWLKKQAQRRGLPLRFPLYDERDSRLINVNDLWGAYQEPVVMASRRYATPVIVDVVLSLDESNQWQTQWTLFQGEETEYWRLTGSELEQVVNQGIDELMRHVAKHYVNVAVAGKGETLIYVSGVSNVFNYKRVGQYLNDLAVVKKAELVQVSPDELVFRLDLRSSAQQLKKTISLGKTLVAQDDFNVEGQNARLVYRLVQ